MTKVVMRVEGLTKSFGSLTAVNNLDLDVLEGEILGFLGPNGAGKTTAISMMCGLLKPDSGTVILHGEPIADRARSRIGLCPQDIALWDRLSCVEQLQFAAAMHGLPRARARAASERLLSEFGLSEKRNKQARTLSGGMQRRLNVALALVHDPDIVFLDEPEIGLDPQSRVMVRDYIRSFAGAKTVILTTHNMDEADRLSDRVAIIDHGELLALDTSTALKRSIGEEDVLEIELAARPSDPESVRTVIAELSCNAEFDSTGSVLYVRGSSVFKRLPAIAEELTKAGAEFGEMRIRQTTLEDVFIRLTGRSLRQ